MHIPAKLREARKSLGLTQAAAAELVGTSQRSVAHWETGKGFPEFQTFVSYLSKLDIPPDWLLNPARTESVQVARDFAGLVRDLGPVDIRRRCLGLAGSPEVGRTIGSAPLDPFSDRESINNDPPSKPEPHRPPRGR